MPRPPVRSVLLIGWLLVAGCGDDDGPGFVFTDGATPAPQPPPASGGDAGVPGLGDCPPGTEWIYLIDHDRTFIRFEPRTRMLRAIGTLSCPAGDASPFSMGIARDGYARVLYGDGHLFRVSLTDLACTPLPFEPGQQAFELFGMGYSADALGSAEETLWIGGGPVLTGGADASMALGSLDDALAVTRVSTLPSLPELSGTGNGDLWGFFPQESPMVVRELDKTSGRTLQTFDVSGVADGGTTLSYAFAYWGGRFYIFFKSEAGESSSIWALTTDLGSLELIVPQSGYRIVGAGVSTCAPVELI